MKILFIPNWKLHFLDDDNETIQAPDKYVKGKPYWFFRYFPEDTKVDVIDIGKMNLFRKIEKKIKFYFCQPVKAFKCRNKYNIVISHGAQSGLVYELLCSFVKHKPKHIMLDVGGLNGARSNPLEVFMIRFALRKKPTIIIHSSRQISLYRTLYPQLVENVHFIPFGVDYDYFSRFANEDKTKDYAISFGSYKRDYPTLLKAWKLLSNPKQLRIIGADISKYQMSIPENVSFTGKCHLSELINQINKSRCVVLALPEYNYSYGQMSFLQSMALGKVLIVTLTIPSIDYISDAPGVFSVEPNSPEKLADCIDKVFSLPEEKLKELGKANQDYVSSRFNEKQMAEKFYDLCKQDCL